MLTTYKKFSIIQFNFRDNINRVHLENMNLKDEIETE